MRNQAIKENQKLNESRGSEASEEEKEPVASTPFFQKLQSLTDKITVFKSQFYEKRPRPLINYDKVLKEKKLNFGTFKNIYGHSENKGPRIVKIGG